jgi:acyl-CoA synthetase (AMP-forming)/AMP-acid ligase II
VHGLKLAVAGGMAVQRAVAEKWKQVTGVPIVEAYGLTETSPAATANALDIKDWTVRYGSSGPAGQTTAARELAVPGMPLAWRSALPGAIATLDLRSNAVAPAAPGWWGATRSASLALLAVSALLFASAIVRRVAAGGRLRVRRRVKRASAREVQAAFAGIREADVTNPARRLAAYDDLEATVRRMVAGLTTAPAAALTPGELRARLTNAATNVDVDDIARVLEECERARYQPIERLPGTSDFNAASEAAERALSNTR